MWSVALLAFAIDALIGEPRRWHPLVGFGRWARALEDCLYANRRRRGLVALGLAVLPPVLLVTLLSFIPSMATLVSVLALYAAIGLRSLHEHGYAVAHALETGDLDQARTCLSHIVSRDTAALEPSQVAAGATESVLENGNDAVFGAFFWFLLAGAPGVVFYRLVNTLDAMWGYRNSRYGRFGWAAARLDDVLNWIPARLTALTYAVCGRYRRALACWRTQAPAWDSPNAGPVMAAGAGALGVRLGGPAPYEGQWHDRPMLGEGSEPESGHVHDALSLVRRGAVLWLILVFLVEWSGLAHWMLHA
ncbi:adenosylcobinamide-phosphate synthase CbiB [Tahibacter amnicola]|uniref:Cobalamin biosynthesis protein CobD n=1 Tax=Tahibacter amnicola TaxID=2976241 RepID=A0ABY6BSF4_9GAMM|nr:adenosylcobinamide-phosphate synthase CbiB [Tahibacter amnicola]UXI70707.1 adenosylcobinamide-phosphate synthase CbiB [Tahibacter amnicola]